MLITENTKISKIISYNEEAIAVIASINSNFNKLRNPILRKLLAPRVNIKEASKIGGVCSKYLLEKLETIGFEIEINEIVYENKTQKINIMRKKDIVELDVRPILSGGTDPFKEIMKTLGTMSDEQTLLIINTFEPVPLLNKLKTQGYEYEVERPNDSEVHTYLTKTGEKAEEKTSTEVVELSFEEAEAKFAGKMHEINVRDLEMPMPMVTILEEIEHLDEGHALFVHHKRLPQYLLPELEDRNFIFSKKEIDESNLKLIIYKK